MIYYFIAWGRDWNSYEEEIEIHLFSWVGKVLEGA